MNFREWIFAESLLLNYKYSIDKNILIVICDNGGNQVLGQQRLVNYSTVNYVDLYETRAVRHTQGHGVARNGISTYSSTSTSNQEWTKLGRGTLTLNESGCYFVGGGQQRTIDRSKIISAEYFADSSGIQIAVSNRQKMMKFLLPGRTVADGQRLANAILNGNSSVTLTEIASNPGGSFLGGAGKLVKYIVILFIVILLFFILVSRLQRIGLILWIIIVIGLIYFIRKF